MMEEDFYRDELYVRACRHLRELYPRKSRARTFGGVVRDAYRYSRAISEAIRRAKAEMDIEKP